MISYQHKRSELNRTVGSEKEPSLPSPARCLPEAGAADRFGISPRDFVIVCEPTGGLFYTQAGLIYVFSCSFFLRCIFLIFLVIQ